jgi:hypothetical protein
MDPTDPSNQIANLQSQIDALTAQVNQNNFSGTQIFNKSIIFNTHLRVPIYSVAPTVCAVGEIICVNGILYICTVANTTFTKVGSQ